VIQIWLSNKKNVTSHEIKCVDGGAGTQFKKGLLVLIYCLKGGKD
jgi:hypothetical protein